MQRSLWILSNEPYVTIRLCDVPSGLYRELVRRATNHKTPFILTDGEWSQIRPEAFLRIIRRVNGEVAVVTFVFRPDEECQWLDVPEPGVELYYSGNVGCEEVSVRILSCVSALLNWPAEESHAS
jgi:hypothetical protein